jgi:hypothetical protein
MIILNTKLRKVSISAAVLCFLLLYPSHVYGVGLDLNVSGMFGETLGIGGAQVEEHEFFWKNTDALLKSFSGGGLMTADIVFTPAFAVETGAGFMHSGREFTAVDGEKYGNGIVSVQYNRIQVPFGLQYRYRFKDSPDEKKILVTGGVLLSFLTGEQVYKDELTTASSNYISPSFSQQFFLSVRYLADLGSGRLIAGIRADIDIMPLSYTINGYDVDMGRSLPVVFEIGYSFPIVINSAVEKENIRKRRVDVYERSN